MTEESRSQSSIDFNPLMFDTELTILLKRLGKVKKYKTFQRWKAKFLDRLEQFLYDNGTKAAEDALAKFSSLLKKVLKIANKVQEYIDNGDFADSKKTVKTSISLNQMCHTLIELIDSMEKVIPKNSAEREKRGFTKFHVGATLIRQGFQQYAMMNAINDGLVDIGNKLKDITNRHQRETFDSYRESVLLFCDIMADLQIYEVMTKSIEFLESPEEEESSDEEEISIKITIESIHNKKQLKLILDPTADTIEIIQSAIAKGCGIEANKQMLKFNGRHLEKTDATLEFYDIQDGSKLTVEAYKVPITMRTIDGENSTILIDPTDSLSDIKIQLEEKTGIPARIQTLFINGHELTDPNKTAKECGFEPGSSLEVVPKFIKVKVRTPDGKTTSLKIKATDTVEAVKARIEQETGLEISRQVLKKIKGGNEIKNGSKLKDACLQDESELIVEIYKLPVVVKTLDGKSVEVMVDPTDRLSDLKEQLAKVTGVKPDNQKLTLDGKDKFSSIPHDSSDLSDNTIEDYGITAGSVINVEPYVVNLNIKKPDGERIIVKMQLSDTGEVLKKKIAEQLGMTVAQQLLKHKGKEFSNPKTLKDMGILEDANLTAEIYKVSVTVNDKMNGKTSKIMIDPTDRISDIKIQLEKAYGIPAKNQKVYINKEELLYDDPSKSANDCGIEKLSVIDLDAIVLVVNVQAPGGKKYEIEINPSDTENDIKSQMEKTLGISVSRQVLKVKGGELLKGNKTAREAGLKHGSDINLELFTLPITVKRSSIDGESTITLNVEPCDSIDKIKKMIQEETGTDAKKQILKLGEETVAGGQSLEDYDIIDKGGLTLVLEEHDDPIIFVDIKSGTLFAEERDLVIEKHILNLVDAGDKFNFVEAAKNVLSKEKIFETMKRSPNLGVSSTTVVTPSEVEDFVFENKGMVKGFWGVSLKHREKNKKGEEFFFVDPKTKRCGELSRQQCITMKFITVTDGSINEGEEDVQNYDKYISMIRNVFGMKMFSHK